MDSSSSVKYRPPEAEPPRESHLPLAVGLGISVLLLALQVVLGADGLPPVRLAVSLAFVWLLALCLDQAMLARVRKRSASRSLARLEAEIAERARAEEALRRGEERYRLLFERNPGGVYRSTVDGRLLDCNEAFARMFGYPTREAMLAQTTPTLYSDPADRTALIARLFEEGSLLNVEVPFRKAGGQPFWGIMCEGLLRAEDGSLTILEGTILDITALKQAVNDRQQAEEALRESESSILSLYNVASAQNLSFDEKAAAMLELGCQRFGMEVGILARVQGGRYEVVAVRSPDNAIMRGVVLELTDTDETLGSASTVSFERAGSSPRGAHPAFSSWGMESYLGAPVRVAGRIFGTLNFANPDPRPTPFRPSDLEFLKLMTLWLGGELEREQRNREIVLLSELGGLLQTCDSIEEAYQVISRQGRKLFPDLSGAVYKLSASKTDLELVSSWGDDGPWAGADFFRPEDCWGLRLGRDHCVDDPAADLLCRHVDEANPPRYLCLPMMAQGEALGVLHLRVEKSSSSVVGSSGPGPLNEARRRLATAVAEHTAMALANLTLRETLRHQSIRDPLTGLFNRRYFEESLDREVRRARRRGVGLGIIMLDLDRFKVVNDEFGHEAGDVLLRAFGDFLRRNVRGEDVACRWGGEEFAVLLPEATIETTRERAEELRLGVKGIQAPYQNLMLGPVTISLGVAVFPDQGLSGQAVLRAADAALYQSKASGRDRVTSALQIAG